ncbi:hypothetical protein ACFWPX_33290 [Nocardia sp. NPDC058518]|uniref:hypothetical protein n=1 Tax=Nocardia sp. NPDC058518 TaxID=3346534 RepID=UPI00364A5444
MSIDTVAADMDYAGTFSLIGAEIDQAWKQRNYDPGCFPEIAEAAAARVPAVELDELLIGHHQLLVLSYKFSDFDVRIFSNDRFRIEILVWLGGSTSIHQHSFSGAFSVLRGRSVHVEYEFDLRTEIQQELSIGDLTPRGSEILEAGDVRRIHSGSRFIHANFHITHPTVTMVIRTHQDRGSGPQLNYLPPYVAIDPTIDQDRRARQRRLIEVLARTGSPELVRRGAESLWPTRPSVAQTLDFLKMPAVVGDPELHSRSLDRAADLHPELSDELAAVSREELRRLKTRLLLPRVTGEEQQLFVALLLNLTRSQDILTHLEREFIGEAPAAAATRLLVELSSAGHLPAIPARSQQSLREVIAGDVGPETYPELSEITGSTVLRHLFHDSV